MCEQWGNLYTSSDGLLRITFNLSYSKIQFITIPIHIGTGPVCFVKLKQEDNKQKTIFRLWSSDNMGDVTASTWNCEYYSMGI